MRRPFQYSDEDWRAIEACLTKLVPHAETGAFVHWRVHLEAMMDAYLYRMTYFDPRSPVQIEVKTCWAKIAKHAHALNTAVDKLEAIDPWRTDVLRHVIVFATDPMTPPADYLVWKNQNAEAARLAAREAKGFKKSARGSTARAALPLISYSLCYLRFGLIAVGALAREAIARRRDL